MRSKHGVSARQMEAPRLAQRQSSLLMRSEAKPVRSVGDAASVGTSDREVGAVAGAVV